MVVTGFPSHYLIAYQNLMAIKIQPGPGSSTGRHTSGEGRAVAARFPGKIGGAPSGEGRAVAERSPCNIDGASAVARATSMAYLLSLRRLGGRAVQVTYCGPRGGSVTIV
jgi:hypothetical protein